MAFNMSYHRCITQVAEHAVQTFKAGFKHMTSGSVESRIARFLFDYCVTLQGTTGSTPAELLMKWNLRSRLDLLIPDVSNRVFQVQEHKKLTIILQQKIDNLWLMIMLW